MNHRLLRIAPALTLAAVAAGCATQADRYQRPPIEAPARWAGTALDDQWPDARWWAGFGSAELDALMMQAQASSHDLRAAAARVEQARASAAGAAAGLYPTVGLGMAAERGREPSQRAASGWTLGPQVGYEVDLWGRHRDAARAGAAALLASEFDREAVRLAVTADVANSYFLILSLNDRLHVARENVAVARGLFDLLAVHQRGGRATSLEVERQRALVASTEAAIPVLSEQRVAARGALAVLLGRSLEHAPDPQGSLGSLALPRASGGVPAQLVERRPDIRRAEANMIAANADVGAARGALLPNLTLRALGGRSAGSAAALLGPGTAFYGLAAGLAFTIFDGGALRAGVALAQARRSERVDLYLQAVVSAFREVENALAGIEHFATEQELLSTAARSAREAYRLMDLRYHAGAESYLNVLDAQRTQLGAESAVHQARLARFTAATALYRALGGGWNAQPALAQGQAPR